MSSNDAKLAVSLVKTWALTDTDVDLCIDKVQVEVGWHWRLRSKTGSLVLGERDLRLLRVALDEAIGDA